MLFLPKPYLKVLKRRDFFLLSLINLVGQAASAFLVLALIVSVFLKTRSNLGVSGVILSFTIPALLLMAFSGLAADIFDRRKIIIVANVFITFVVLAIILNLNFVYASIPLSFLYFAGNSFFIPASSAATAQLVGGNELLIANSIFIFTLAGGVLGGLFIASLVYFFFGSQVTLIICEALLAMAAVLSFFLPKLLPSSKVKNESINKRVEFIFEGLVYVFKSRITMFSFFVFALIQGLIFFGITLAPGFFTEIVGFSIQRTIVIIFPLIAIGVLVGFLVIRKPRVGEFVLLSRGTYAMGMALFLYGLVIKLGLFGRLVVTLLSAPFLIFLGFGSILIMVGSRTVLQKEIPHSHQGTVFGANIVVVSMIATIASPIAVVSEVVFGYLGTFVGGGVALVLLAFTFNYLGSRWKK